MTEPDGVKSELEEARASIAELRHEREGLLDEIARLRRRDTQIEVLALEQEKSGLLDEVARLRRKIIELEEENDLLAVANEQLRSGRGVGIGLGLGGALAVTALTASTSGNRLSATATESSIATDPGTPRARARIGIFALEQDASFLDAGDEVYPTTQMCKLDRVCGGLNPIACRLWRSCRGGEGEWLAAVGGVDKFLGVHRVDPSGLSPPAKVCELGGFPGPILSLDLDPATAQADAPRALVTCMDGSHLLVSLGQEPAVLAQAKSHEKHAVVGRWSADGSVFATGAHDKSAKLYQRDGTLLKEFFFSGNVEALAFVKPPITPDDVTAAPPTSTSTSTSTEQQDVWLIVSSRGVPYLSYINTRTFEKRHVSVNAAEWDEHVSFAILSLAVSPCQRYLLAATDKSRLIIFRIGSNQAVRTLFGHVTDEYGNPRVQWDRTGKYVFCSSQEGNKVLCWCVASERVVWTLSGHEGAIRDVAYCDGVLATVGFDKTLRVWAKP